MNDSGYDCANHSTQENCSETVHQEQDRPECFFSNKQRHGGFDHLQALVVPRQFNFNVFQITAPGFPLSGELLLGDGP